MFDIGFSELIIIGLVALIVFGPEELPRVARTAGHLLGKFRRYVADVKADISREMEVADIKRMQHEIQSTAAELQNSLNDQARALHDEFRQTVAPGVESARDGLSDSTESPVGARQGTMPGAGSPAVGPVESGRSAGESGGRHVPEGLSANTGQQVEHKG